MVIVDQYSYCITINKIWIWIVTKKAAAIATDLKKINNRFAIGEIDQTVYSNATEDLVNELTEIQNKIKQAATKLSNPSEFIEFAVSLSQNLDIAWLSADNFTRSKLQRIVFPDGIIYDRPTTSYRTIKVNSLF